MEIKKLEGFEESMITENQHDINNIKTFIGYIHQLGIPSFEAHIQGFQGQILVDGIVSFTTSGANTVPTIFAYVCGVLLGLRKGKK